MAILYIGTTCISIDSCEVHTIYDAKAKDLATLAKSKSILLASWEFF